MNPQRKKESDDVLSIRPKVADLAFHVFGRALHPELFQVYQRTSINRGLYQARIEILSGGHHITWRYHGVTLAEVAAPMYQPLPKSRLLVQHRLRGEKSLRIDGRGGVVYHTSFQLENLPADIFWTFQEELVRDGEHRGLLFQFPSSGRMALGAISYIHFETRARSMCVQAFHTFPDDYAVVKSQSVFDLP